MAYDNINLDTIADAKPVRVFLPLKGIDERYRAQGIYQKSTPPVFSLLFKAGSLPTESIDPRKNAIVNIDMGGPSLSLEANITEIVSNQHLIMRAVNSMSHEQMREFFRVDTVTSVIGRSFPSQAKQASAGAYMNWALKGETIDISGSGILASFPEKPPEDEFIRLEITLPTVEPETVSVLARPIRSVQTGDNRWDVAYQFDEITTEDRDKIIGCCLEIQRKLLRLKVNVKDL
jgi:c-di-GMP-binding flagellar brake protein YcgR